MKPTVLTVIGTRPEAIKLCPIVLELQDRSSEFHSVVCATGQHREMLDQVLGLFGVFPDFDLNLMSPGQTLAQVTSRAVTGLDEVIQQVQTKYHARSGGHHHGVLRVVGSALSQSCRGACRSRTAYRRQICTVSRGNEPSIDWTFGRQTLCANRTRRARLTP